MAYGSASCEHPWFFFILCINPVDKRNLDLRPIHRMSFRSRTYWLVYGDLGLHEFELQFVPEQESYSDT